MTEEISETITYLYNRRGALRIVVFSTVKIHSRGCFICTITGNLLIEFMVSHGAFTPEYFQPSLGYCH